MRPKRAHCLIAHIAWRSLFDCLITAPLWIDSVQYLITLPPEFSNLSTFLTFFQLKFKITQNFLPNSAQNILHWVSLLTSCGKKII